MLAVWTMVSVRFRMKLRSFASIRGIFSPIEVKLTLKGGHLDRQQLGRVVGALLQILSETRCSGRNIALFYSGALSDIGDLLPAGNDTVQKNIGAVSILRMTLGNELSSKFSSSFSSEMSASENS